MRIAAGLSGGAARVLRAVFAVLWLAVCVLSCVILPSHDARARDSGTGAATIYVTSNGWHTGIVIPRTALPPRGPPVDWFSTRISETKGLGRSTSNADSEPWSSV